MTDWYLAQDPIPPPCEQCPKPLREEDNIKLAKWIDATPRLPQSDLSAAVKTAAWQANGRQIVIATSGLAICSRHWQHVQRPAHACLRLACTFDITLVCGPHCTHACVFLPAGNHHALSTFLERWLSSLSKTSVNDITQHVIVLCLGERALQPCMSARLLSGYSHHCLLDAAWVGTDQAYLFPDDWFVLLVEDAFVTCHDTVHDGGCSASSQSHSIKKGDLLLSESASWAEFVQEAHSCISMQSYGLAWKSCLALHELKMLPCMYAGMSL